MPHPSIPLDDFRAHSFNREHGPARAGSRGRLVADVCARKGHSEVDQRVERLSDGIYLRCTVLSNPFDFCALTNQNIRCTGEQMGLMASRK
ncbi:hypothetical protein C8R44DRAFT_698438, partial [Mycena epipterygia]